MLHHMITASSADGSQGNEHPNAVRAGWQVVPGQSVAFGLPPIKGTTQVCWTPQGLLCITDTLVSDPGCLCRLNAAANELICDELGVAYPIINGIPRLIPTEGRVLDADSR